MVASNLANASWEDVTSTDTWDSLPQKDKENLARFYARKVLQPKHGKGSQEVKDFLSKNLTPVKVDETSTLENIAGALPSLDGPVSDEFSKGFDNNATGIISQKLRGEPINVDLKAVPKGLYDTYQEIKDAGSSIAGDIRRGNFDNFGTGLAGAGAYTLGSFMDPVGLAAGGLGGKAANIGLKAAATATEKSLPLASRAIAATTPIATGMAGGMAMGSAAPIAEGRMPTSGDLAVPTLLGALGGVAKTQFPELRFGGKRSAASSGESTGGDPGAEGPSGPEGPSGSDNQGPNTGGGQGTGRQGEGYSQDGSGQSDPGSGSWADWLRLRGKKPQAGIPQKPKWFRGSDEEWAQDPEGHINRYAENIRKAQEQSRQKAEQDQAQREAEQEQARQQSEQEQSGDQGGFNAEEQARKWAEDQRKQWDNESASKSNGGDQGGFDPGEQARKRAEEASRNNNGNQRPEAPPKDNTMGGEPDPTTNAELKARIEARKAEVQKYLDQAPEVERMTNISTKKQDKTIANSENAIRALSPAKADSLIKAARINDLRRQGLELDRLLFKDANKAELARHVSIIRKALDTKVSNELRLKGLKEEVTGWQAIMEKLLRGEEGSATPEGALGMPLLEAGGKAISKAAEFARAISREIADLAKKHGERNASVGLPHFIGEEAPAGAANGARAMQGEPGAQPVNPQAQSPQPAGKRTIDKVKEQAKRLIEDESGSFNVNDLADMASKALSFAGRVVIDGAQIARKIHAAIKYPAWLIDDIWAHMPLKNGKSVAQMLNDYYVALKYGKSSFKLINAMKRFFFTNFGVPIDVLAMDEAAKDAARYEAMPGWRNARRLQKTLTPAEQERLSYEMGEKAPMARSQEAIDMSDYITDKSELLKDVGALGHDAFDRWKGFYLPRIYRDKFPVFSEWIREVSNLRGHKMRGKQVTMSQKRFDYYNQHWTVAAISKVAGGKDMATLVSSGGDRVTVPIDKVDDYLSDWEDRGSPASDPFMIHAWRDWSYAERLDKGEVHHGVMRIFKFLERFEQDFARGKFFDDLSKDRRYAIPAKGIKPGMQPPGWELIPNAVNKDGTHKWGHLANHYVDPDVHAYLTWTYEWLGYIKWAKGVMGQNVWKKFQTIWQPQYYENNFMQNLPWLEAQGGSVFDIPLAINEIIHDTPLIQGLERYRGIKNGAIMKELALLLHSDPAFSLTPKDLMSSLAEAVKKLEARGGQLSGITDDLFRVALALQRQREGFTNYKDLAEMIKGSFYDPGDFTSPMAEITTMWAPFAKPLFFTFDKAATVMINHPAKGLLALAQAHAAALTAFLSAGYDTKEKRKGFEALMADYQKSNPFTRLPGAIPTNFKNAFGQKINLDIHNWDPGNTVVDNPRMELPYVPAPLLPSGPAFSMAQMVLNQGKSPYEPMRRYSPEGVQIRDDTGSFIMENFAPPIIGRTASKLSDAFSGRAKASGLRDDATTSILNVLGIPLRTYDPNVSFEQINKRYSSMQRDLQAQANRLAMEMSRNPQDKDTILQQMDKINARKQQLSQEYQKWSQTASQGILPQGAIRQ